MLTIAANTISVSVLKTGFLRMFMIKMIRGVLIKWYKLNRKFYWRAIPAVGKE
jgi:hypothetical protein